MLDFGNAGLIGDGPNPDQIRLRKGRAIHKRGLGHFLGRGPGGGGKPKSNCAINADQRPKFPLWVREFGQYRVVDTGLFRPLERFPFK